MKKIPLLSAKSMATVFMAAILLFSVRPSIAGQAKGSLVFPKGTATLSYSFLVKGPDAVDTSKMIRRIIFSPQDLGAKIAACAAMDCVDGLLTEGLIVDLDAGPRLNYWMVLKGGLVQYSGTQVPESLKATANDAKRVAGKLQFDGAAAGGPKVDVEFDAPITKEFTKAR